MSETRVVNRIRELRMSVEGMTQEKLAQSCGVTRQTIIALEGQKYSPSLELAFRLAHALGRKIDDVFAWSAEK